jgi:predicted dehydrogenase
MIETKDRPIGVGVIGLGYWGPNLVRVFKQLEAANLLMVADLKKSRRDYIQGLYPGLPVVEDYREILALNEISLVCVATPMGAHYEISKEILLCGKHLFVEKPFTLQSAQAEELVDLARSKGLMIGVDHIFLYSPVVRKLRESLLDGGIGRIFYLSAKRMNPGPPKPTANVLWDLGPHDVSLILSLIKTDPIKIEVWAKRYGSSVHQASQILLEFEGGVTAHIHLSWLTGNKTRIFEAFGENGYLLYDDLQQSKKIQIFGPPFDNRVGEQADGLISYQYRPGEVVSPEIPPGEPLLIEASGMIESIHSGIPPISDGELGLRVVRVIEKASRLINDKE